MFIHCQQSWVDRSLRVSNERNRENSLICLTLSGRAKSMIRSTWRTSFVFRSWTVMVTLSAFLKLWTNSTEKRSPKTTSSSSKWFVFLALSFHVDSILLIERFRCSGFLGVLRSRNSQYTSIWKRASSNSQTECCLRSFIVSRQCLWRWCSTNITSLCARSESSSSLCLGIQRHVVDRRWNSFNQHSNVSRTGFSQKISNFTRYHLSLDSERQEKLSASDLS